MKKLKIIRGSVTRAEEVRETLKKWGAVDIGEYSCKDENSYYFEIDGKTGWMYTTDQVLKYMNYEVVELPEPKPQPEHQFKPFDRVLVRDQVGDPWRCNLFSHKVDDKEYPFYCINTVWNFCIPYEGNEHLVGTTDSPKGGEE